MTQIIAGIAAFWMVYSIVVIGDCVTRQPLTATHKLHIERKQTIYMVFLVLAALVFGLCLDRLLP